MTTFNLQFVIPGILAIILGVVLIFWKDFDSIFSDLLNENSKKSITQSRYFYSALCIVLGVLAILTVIFDWPVAGYLIPPPQ